MVTEWPLACRVPRADTRAHEGRNYRGNEEPRGKEAHGKARRIRGEHMKVAFGCRVLFASSFT